MATESIESTERRKRSMFSPYSMPLKTLIACFFISFSPFSKKFIKSQEDHRMLIFQLDGNNYMRKNFSKDEELDGYQRFMVGKVEKRNEKHVLPIKIYDYNGKELEDSSITKYACKPSDRSVLLKVFPFSEFNSNKNIQVNLKDSKVLYPSDWKKDKDLKDVYFSVSIKGGVLGVFGTSSKVHIKDRRVVSTDTSKNTYTIEEKMTIETFMYGIKADQLEYSIKETLDPEKGIIRQKFDNPEGGYFTVHLEE